MSRTPSTMLELTTKAPEFILPNPVTGDDISLTNYIGKPILIAFICNHCPYVIHIADALAKFADNYQSQGLNIIAINANDVENYADDSPEKMIDAVSKYGYNFPYLYDKTQQTAKAYQAACTPDFFLFDAEHRLYYRGQFDSSRPGNNVPVTGGDMRNAAELLLAGKPAPEEQLASLGCNIKWKAGNEPEYFL
jgi:thiol-disulfide isomerase/thioredoxin